MLSPLTFWKLWEKKYNFHEIIFFYKRLVTLKMGQGHRTWNERVSSIEVIMLCMFRDLALRNTRKWQHLCFVERWNMKHESHGWSWIINYTQCLTALREKHDWISRIQAHEDIIKLYNERLTAQSMILRTFKSCNV